MSIENYSRNLNDLNQIDTERNIGDEMLLQIIPREKELSFIQNIFYFVLNIGDIGVIPYSAITTND
jgi:hypothetical protein